jgi:hypothetical protein
VMRELNYYKKASALAGTYYKHNRCGVGVV